MRAYMYIIRGRRWKLHNDCTACGFDVDITEEVCRLRKWDERRVITEGLAYANSHGSFMYVFMAWHRLLSLISNHPAIRYIRHLQPHSPPSLLNSHKSQVLRSPSRMPSPILCQGQDGGNCMMTARRVFRMLIQQRRITRRLRKWDDRRVIAGSLAYANSPGSFMYIFMEWHRLLLLISNHPAIRSVTFNHIRRLPFSTPISLKSSEPFWNAFAYPLPRARRWKLHDDCTACVSEVDITEDDYSQVEEVG